MNASPCIRRMPPRRLPGLRSLLQFGLCSLLGALLSLLLMLALLFLGLRPLLEPLVGIGQPLGDLILWLLPDSFWQQLTGSTPGARHPALRSLLGLCASLGLHGLLLGFLLYRHWYRRTKP